MKWPIAYILIILPSLGISQEKRYLLSTSSYTIKKLSLPEETYHDLPADWYIDYYSVNTYLVMSHPRGNQLVKVISYKYLSDGRHYIIGKELQGHKMTHEITIDTKEQWLEINSLKPIQGIYVKYFQK
ncbi:MAG: hypothetical protein ABJG78_00435 [Cyclobacteriaceae bacterium]